MKSGATVGELWNAITALIHDMLSSRLARLEEEADSRQKHS